VDFCTKTSVSPNDLVNTPLVLCIISYVTSNNALLLSKSNMLTFNVLLQLL